MRKITILKDLDRVVGRRLVQVMSRMFKPGQDHPVPKKENVIRILVIRPGGLGDAVLINPLLTALRNYYKNATLEVLAEKRNGDIFLCVGPLVDRLFFYDRGVDLFRVLVRRYSVVVDTEQSHYLSAAIARLIRADFRLGYGTNERGRLFHHAAEYVQDRYEVYNFLFLFEILTKTPFAFVPDHPFFPRTEGLPALKYSETPSGLRRFRVIVAPGASIPERRWGWDRYRSLVKGFLEKGAEVVLIGNRADSREADRIAEGQRGFLVNMTGKTDLKGLWELVCSADLLICCDTGVLHLSYGVGTPSVSLFGAGSEVKWAPKGKRHRTLNKHLSCSPCTLFGETPPCPIGVACLETISVEEVERNAWDLLNEKAIPGS